MSATVRTGHWWGLLPPEGTEGPIWGARAIYQSGVSARVAIDLLRDRQQTTGDQAEVRALVTWINEQGIEKLRAECVAHDVDVSDSCRLIVAGGDYIIEADPCASHGYLYLVAYKFQYEILSSA